MILVKIIAAMFLVAQAQSSVQQNRWRGIVPLRSTRADVERLLGMKHESGRTSVYSTEAVTARFEYLISPCKGSLPGWNVPPDTVLQVEVISREKVLFSDLKVDSSKYKKEERPSGYVSYFNLGEGIRYEVMSNGVVYSITYLPSVQDINLRCSGYPAYDGNPTNYRPYDIYGDIPFDMEAGRLDNYASLLLDDPKTKGYVIVYAGRFSPEREVVSRAERARGYLINRRGIEGQRIIALYGGYREETETELYVVPSDTPAPSPTPTVIPNKLNISKEGKIKKRRHQTKTR